MLPSHRTPLPKTQEARARKKLFMEIKSWKAEGISKADALALAEGNERIVQIVYKDTPPGPSFDAEDDDEDEEEGGEE